MKRLFLALAAGVLLFSCKEKGPYIDFGPRDFTDTFYTATAETPQPHRVLIEEFTGAACANCPDARTLLANIGDANPERLVVLAIHPYGIPQGAPVYELGRLDFRTQKGTDLMNTVYPSIIGIPIAGIDRIPVNNNMALTRNLWNSAISARLAVTPPVNVSITSTYKESERRATIKVRLAYTQKVDFPHAMTLAILEDGMVDAQEYPTRIDTFYTFKHVLRDIITSINGQNIQPQVPAKDPGYVYEATFNYIVNDAWKPENCQVAAYVHRTDGNNREILQAAEAKLKQP